MVGCATYRNPGLLAKITSNIDVISGAGSTGATATSSWPPRTAARSATPSRCSARTHPSSSVAAVSS